MCIKCGSVFHRSCAKKNKQLTPLGGVWIACCKTEESEVNNFTQENAALLRQVALLNRLVEEMSDKNQIMKDHITLLNEKVKYLEKELINKQNNAISGQLTQIEKKTTNDNKRSLPKEIISDKNNTEISKYSNSRKRAKSTTVINEGSLINEARTPIDKPHITMGKERTPISRAPYSLATRDLRGLSTDAAEREIIEHSPKNGLEYYIQKKKEEKCTTRNHRIVY